MPLGLCGISRARGKGDWLQRQFCRAASHALPNGEVREASPAPLAANSFESIGAPIPNKTANIDCLRGIAGDGGGLTGEFQGHPCAEPRTCVSEAGTGVKTDPDAVIETLRDVGR